MFERYTERARRVIFFAPYEASQLGSAAIEPDDLLLGMTALDQKFLRALKITVDDEWRGDRTPGARPRRRAEARSRRIRAA